MNEQKQQTEKLAAAFPGRTVSVEAHYIRQVYLHGVCPEWRWAYYCHVHHRGPGGCELWKGPDMAECVDRAIREGTAPVSRLDNDEPIVMTTIEAIEWDHANRQSDANGVNLGTVLSEVTDDDAISPTPFDPPGAA